MYTLISGSGKNNKSNSELFLSKFNNNYIYNLKIHNYKKIIKSIKKSDTIILAFPLYVDSPPSIVLEFLEYLMKYNIKNKKIYIIINCGFLESTHNIIANNIVKSWCKKNSWEFGGSILIGAGEVIGNSKYSFITNNCYKKLNYFYEQIRNNKNIKEIYTSIPLSKNIFIIMANHYWKRKIKE